MTIWVNYTFDPYNLIFAQGNNRRVGTLAQGKKVIIFTPKRLATTFPNDNSNGIS